VLAFATRRPTELKQIPQDRHLHARVAVQDIAALDEGGGFAAIGHRGMTMTAQ
jgi:hypothetical protein